MEKVRIHKYLAQAWLCSRRKAEEYIEKWLVKINWEVAVIWQQIDPEIDKVIIDNEQIKAQEKFVYYKINKPRWVVTTCKSTEKDTAIIDIINISERVFPIGRLDKDTTWLILLTNDWRLSNYLIHPRYEHEKEYVVQVYWTIDDEALKKMSNWLYILWSRTKPCEIERVSSWMFKIILKEWKNRQIRRMVEAVGKEVKRLKRIRIENIHLWDMKEWDYKEISNSELKELFNRLWLKM